MGLGARLAVAFAVVTAAAALLVGSASYVTTDRQVIAEIDKFLQQRADEIDDGQRSIPRGRGDDRDSGQVFVAVSPDAEVQILDSNGEVSSNTGLLLPVNDTDLKIAADNQRSEKRTVTIDGVEYRMLTEQLSGGGAVQVARSLEESVSILGGVQSRTVWIAAVVAVLAAAAGWVIAQRTTRPLRALTRAVDEVAVTRDFSTQVPTSGRDEVGRLADGFNRMLGVLAQSQEQQHRLVQDAAHELRTPLTSVTANVEWLMRASDLDAETRGQTLAGIRRELGELNDLMAEIIELATESHEAPILVGVDLAAVAADAVDLFADRTGRHVDFQSSPLTVMGDADALARALSNLLANADKYSPADAPIAVSVGPDGVFVDDAGPGIPEAEREMVFERFYRRVEDRALPGSGLGLSIVADTVRQHGGLVHVSRSELGGARVGFVLPG